MEDGRSGVLSDVWSQLERIFRHVLPGLTIVGMAATAHPRWFENVRWNDPWHLITIGVVAIVIGNAWFVLHRYTVEQGLDILASRRRRGTWRGYRASLVEHLVSWSKRPRSPGREYFFLRSAHASYVFILAEVTVCLSLNPAAGSFLSRWRGPVVGLGILAFVAALFQWWILEELDWRSDQAAEGQAEVRGK